MIIRRLQQPISELALAAGKMAFISGPRQCGKTTLSRMIAPEHERWTYYNWDESEFRRLWATAPSLTVDRAMGAMGLPAGHRPLIIYDEIHKARLWKRTLKGIYDTLSAPVDIIVTGSARLNIYRRGSDSLQGRYYLFRLSPFTLGEFTGSPGLLPDALSEALIMRHPPAKAESSAMADMLRFGGFPEPLLSASERKARLWRRTHVERIVREDLRDLSRLPELSQIQTLTSLLSHCTGSLFSRASLARDLEVAYDTIKRWTTYLGELYYMFEVRPFSRHIRRSLRKETKAYLWDYAEIADPAQRFENMVACHLLSACQYWTDTGEGTFELYYLRDKQKREIDFLIVRDGKPFLPVEAKMAEAAPSPAFASFGPQIGCLVGLQIVAAADHWRQHTFPTGNVLVASADRVLPLLP